MLYNRGDVEKMRTGNRPISIIPFNYHKYIKMKIHLSFLLSVIIIGCYAPNSEELPFNSGSRYPHLTKTEKGGLLVSWFEPVDSTIFGLFWSEFSNNEWSLKTLIYSSDHFFINWADFPSIFELDENTIVAHWPEMSAEGTYDYDVRISYSKDRGKTWSEPISPHRDGKEAEHGFVSFYKNETHELEMVWLDGREMAGGNGHESAGDMNLYTTSFDRDFKQRHDISIDAMVCECCPTTAVQSEKVTIVAYRDRTPSEVRNINILRKVNGEWENPYPVNEDGWIIPGCPVNGPKLAEKNGKVAIAWFTAPDGESQINVAFSNNQGKTFSYPIRVDGGQSQGRVDLEWLNEKTVVASWLDAKEEYSSIVYRKIETNGTLSEISYVESLGGGRGIGYPQFELMEDKILFVWTDPLGKNQIKSRWIDL
jgi:hypothetical protein